MILAISLLVVGSLLELAGILALSEPLRSKRPGLGPPLLAAGTLAWMAGFALFFFG